MDDKPLDSQGDVEENEGAAQSGPEGGAADASYDALFENYDAPRPMGREDQPQQREDRLKSVIEALLFVSNAPLTLKKLADAVPDYPRKDITRAIAELRTDYIRQDRGFLIEEIAGGYQMLSNPEHVDYVQRLHAKETSARLTPTMMETLAIIAYRQPVLRADVEAIRGVQAGPILRNLMERGLIKVAGRADEAGRPFLYGTTKKFLEHFGLRSLEDLPNVEELKPPDDS
jgi:segregation and condensation protein B